MILLPKPANLEIPSPPTSPRSAAPPAPSDLAAVRRRQAALQQCGLVPVPRRDLSQLEAELDRRFSHVVTLPQDQQDQEDDLTSAERIRREWQAKNEAQPETQGGDPESKVPNDVPSDSLNPERPGKSDSTSNTEEPKPLEFTALPSGGLLPNLKSPIPLSPILETSSFHDIPEEDVDPYENDKELPSLPLPGPVDPLVIPLPDSPLSSFANLPDLPPSPTSRESKRPPPIVVNLTTSDFKETEDDAPRGRSVNRDSMQSIASKSSIPALSPTMTASSSSTLPTPRDEESRERMEAVINRTGSIKSRSSRLGRATGRDSEELELVHETIHESPEPSTTESRTWNPNRESNATMGSAGFEAFVEKREKRRRMSTGIFQPSKRSSSSIKSSRKSVGSDFGSMWSAIANDFALKPLEGGKQKSSTLPLKPTSANQNNELTSSQSHPATEQPQPKITRSKSVMASLGLRMTRKAAPPTLSPSLPASPMRRPTIRVMENRERENLIQEVKGIEDDESRRLTELAFMDF